MRSLDNPFEEFNILNENKKKRNIKSNAPTIERELNSNQCPVCTFKKEAELIKNEINKERNEVISIVGGSIFIGLLIGVSIGCTVFYWDKI